MEKTFSSSAILKESFEIIKPRFWKVVGQFAFILVAFCILSFFTHQNFFLGLLLSTLLAFGSTVFSFAYVEQGTFSLKTMFDTLTLKKFLTLLVAIILAGLATIAGVFLLVIPGIIMVVQLHFYKYIIVKKDIKALDALKESARLTKGYRFKIFEFIVVTLLINILGAICVGVGLFFTVPLTLIGFTLIYKKLLEEGSTKEEGKGEVVEAKVLEA